MVKYKIGEIASLLGVSIDTLRLYDKKGIVCPERGENGYRYYSRSQMIILNYVIHLKKANLSLEYIRNLVNETDVEKSIEILSESEQHIKNEIAKLQKIQNVIEDYKNIFKKSFYEHGKFEIKQNLKMVYLKVDKISGFEHPEDFYDLNNEYRFVFSFISCVDVFKVEEEISEREIINSMDYAYSYVIKDDKNIDLFSLEKYEIIQAEKYAYFIIKCKIPTDYSEFLTVFNNIKKAGHKLAGRILFRPTTIRNEENQNIDYYEVFIKIK